MLKNIRPKKIKLLAGIGTIAGLSVALSGCFVPIPIPIPFPGSEAPQTETPGPDLSTDPGENKFFEQDIDWVSCSGGFECATVAAPLDWENPDGGAIEIFLTKQPAKNGDPLGSLFVNPGGPGASGADFVKDSIDYAVGKDLQRNFDVIGWDPRGVGQSSAVKCYDQEEMDEYLFGDPRVYSHLEFGSDEWVEVVRQESREFGEACLEATGELLGYVDTVSTVRDLNLLRALVDDEKLNYLGYSYGTYIGALFADHFPEKVGRLVLDGAIAPNVDVFDVVLMQQQGFESATRAYLDDCLQRAACPFAGTTEDAMKEIDQMIERLEKNPIQAADGRWVSSGTFITAIILPLYNDSNWSLLDSLFAEMRNNQPDTAQWLADYYYSRNLGFYEDNSTEAFSAINCLDYPPGGTIEEMREQAAKIATAAPVFGKYAGYGDISCEEWPFEGVQERGPVTGTGADPILVVGTTGDPATPYAWAQELSQQLESGVLVTYNGEGHGAYSSGNKCVNKTVEDYFLKGKVPESDPNC